MRFLLILTLLLAACTAPTITAPPPGPPDPTAPPTTAPVTLLECRTSVTRLVEKYNARPAIDTHQTVQFVMVDLSIELLMVQKSFSEIQCPDSVQKEYNYFMNSLQEFITAAQFMSNGGFLTPEQFTPISNRARDALNSFIRAAGA